MSAYILSENEKKSLIDTYWQKGEKMNAFAVYFVQLPDWQIYASNLGEALVRVEELESMEEFKDILKWMICSK